LAATFISECALLSNAAQQIKTSRGAAGEFRTSGMRKPPRKSMLNKPGLEGCFGLWRLGDREQTTAWLAKAVSERNWQVLEIGIDPRYESLRSDRSSSALHGRWVSRCSCSA